MLNIDIRKYKSLLTGTLSYIPGATYFRTRFGTGGTNSARYCYSVWLRHLVTASQNDLNTYPTIVAELGPGDSLGVGLAALLSGSEKYYALDAVKYTNKNANLEIMTELIDLFERREKIPDNLEFPNVKPCLESYKFPDHILTENRLNKALNKERIELIKKSIRGLENDERNSMIEYYAPWDNNTIIKNKSVDMIYSQAVMEHVENLENTYKLLSMWLKPNGFMSHEIDFKSHGTSNKWNGHLTYSDAIWRLIKGRKKFLLNRQVYSSHIDIQKKTGFKIVCSIKDNKSSGILKSQLASRFKNVKDEDLTIASALIQSTIG